MTKRAPGKFDRNPRDLYSTPFKAVPFLIPHIDLYLPFGEPCAGERQLVRHLERFAPLSCDYEGDIARGQDARNWKPGPHVGQIITNPPWSKEFCHPLIEHFIATGLPVWLLLDADWMHTVQARRFMARCFKVVSVGRLKWIPDSDHQGLDNAAWYGFHANHIGYSQFVPREHIERAAA